MEHASFPLLRAQSKLAPARSTRHNEASAHRGIAITGFIEMKNAAHLEHGKCAKPDIPKRVGASHGSFKELDSLLNVVRVAEEFSRAHCLGQLLQQNSTPSQTKMRARCFGGVQKERCHRKTQIACQKLTMRETRRAKVDSSWIPPCACSADLTADSCVGLAQPTSEVKKTICPKVYRWQRSSWIFRFLVIAPQSGHD